MFNSSKKIIIAFVNETQVLRMEKELKKIKINSKIISVPRDISAGCGMALEVEEKNKKKCEEIIDEYNIKCDGIYERG